MLQSLTIENIAVIKQAQLDFPAGFVVLTGETGAGKSIVIDAINAVMGERASRDIVRTGEETARVTAVFDETQAVREVLEPLEIPREEDVLLGRTIVASGKSVCRINGEPVTASTLRRVGAVLLNIHGQHDSQALLNPQRHMDFVDAMAENAALREEYRTAYQRLRALQKQQEALRMDEAEKARRLDMLQHQIAELEEAQVRPGERAALQKRRNVMQHSEKILQALGLALQSVAGGELPGAASLAHEAATALESVADVLPAAGELTQTIRAAAYELEESAADLRILSESITIDPAELDAIAQRLDTYYRLRKYGEDETAMLAFLEKARAAEEAIVQSDERICALEGEIEQAREETVRLARLLSKSRREAGALFARGVIAELADLDMPHVRLEVQSEKVPLTAEGGERVEFLISANVGEAPRPLAKIASGGELSRIMLAMKRVLAEKDDTATLIFDEIDAGVSGRAARKIGRKLLEVSRGRTPRQVICVTHLAQIAALADCHLYISKSTQENETFTRIEALNREGRVRELARIMGGEDITAAQLAAAEEMLGDRE